MHTEDPKEPLEDMRYEKRDLNLSGIGKATFFLYAIFFVCTVAAFFIWRALTPTYKNNPRALSVGRVVPGYPNPLLQGNITVRTDIAAMRQQEAQVLGSRGTNPDGSSHIPIDEAMGILAEKGFAPTGNEVPAKTVGNTIKQNALTQEEALKAMQSKGQVGR